MTPPVPDFLCIGTQRSGTTWLHRMLSHAPGYWMPPFKELNVFAPGGPESNGRDKLGFFHKVLGEQLRSGMVDRALLTWHAQLSFAAPRDLQWYQSLFAPAGGRCCGDISPAYFLLDEAQITPIRAALPHLRVVVLLRHPVERADSQAALLEACAPAGTQLSDDSLLRRLTRPPFAGYSDYAAAVSRWEKVFGTDRVGVFFYDHLKRDPAGMLVRISAFLGRAVDPAALGIDVSTWVNHFRHRPRSTAYYLGLARHVLPGILPLRQRWPDPVDTWCRQLEQALSH